MHVLRQGRENRSEIEEFMLYAQQDGGQQREARLLHGELVDVGAGRSQETVQLVHGAVGFDTRPVFWHALAADEACLSGIAPASVYAIDGETGLVERFFSHWRLHVRRLWGGPPGPRGSPWTRFSLKLSATGLIAPSQLSTSCLRRNSVSATGIQTLPH